MKKLFGSLFLLLLLLIPSVSAREAEITLPLRFDNYYTLDQIYEALNVLTKAHPKMTSLEEVGRTEEDRPIYAVTLNNPETGRAMDKPGVYVDGNIHGNEIQGGDILLYLLDYLLANHGKNDEITRIVDRNCFYFVPVVNPDGRFHFMAEANTASSNRSIHIPTDDDNDGLIDEDFPDDLDGDGSICTMRIRDPFGRLKTDPEDPRLMVPVKPGEKGEWTLLGSEGIDNDGDGRLNEDSEGYVDGNRNWGFDWAPPYVQAGSGEYPFSAVGLKALGLWIQSKTNIIIGWTFHNTGGMYLRGPSRKGLGEYPPGDVAVYDFIGKQSERITPGYNYLIGWKDLYTTYGDSLEFLTQFLGAYGYVAEVFQVGTETFRGTEEKAEAPEGQGGMADLLSGGITERERLKFNDHVAQGELYKNWTPFDHPTYGKIEIGGWVKMSSRLSAPFMIKDLVHRNAMVVLFSAKHTPRISLEVTEIKELGKNLYRVRTRLANSGAMPTMTYLAQKVNLHPKDMLKITGKGIKVVAGGTLTDPFNDRAAYVKHRPELQFLFVPGFGKVEHQFLIEGKGEITLNYKSLHAGRLEKTVKLEDTP